MNTLGIYFSGTGNTKHAVERFVESIDNDGTKMALEDPATCKALENSDLIVFGYPVYFSNVPKIVKDFIVTNGKKFSGKKVYIIATMALLSGDGAGCGARLIRKYGGIIIGGLHLKMPDSIADEKSFRQTPEKCQKIIEKANQKIDNATKKMKNGKPTKNGLSLIMRIFGFFMQRAWFGGMTRRYKEKPEVSKNSCIGCGICVNYCPMGNLKIEKEKAVSSNKCTLCYRCVNRCPKQALTIFGKKVRKQHNMEKYR